MSEIERKNIAGMSMKGGRRDKFYFCLLEYFPDSDRWFLHSVLQVRDQQGLGGDEAIRAWIKNFELTKLVVDFPLSNPPCHSCELDCPGVSNCLVDPIVEVRKRILSVLSEDLKLNESHPKSYERKRIENDIFDWDRDILKEETTTPLLSRSFKRRLKKGFLPYWNRSLDFYIWCLYYDQLLEIFNQSFDSFGNTSLMVQARFSYLKRHFPSHLELYESHTSLVLLELLKNDTVKRKQLESMNDLEMSIDVRHHILKSIEKEFDIFIYDNDMDLLLKNPRAFESFLLAIAGKSIYDKSCKEIPDWALPEESRFIIPSY